MKILRLRLTNLNSLRGSWEIDFTQPPLAGSGLFAITGATGAGKSTLLDAITLALYGRAARYGTQPSPDAVMSRHTGECSAEVEFSCATGTYRSVWQLHRARKKPGGDLQQAKRRIIELPNETVLCEKTFVCDAKILELTGLDYDRFLRSVLLAQGDFAAFLKANARERTDLLQQVTGTHVYQDISRAAYARSEVARKSLDDLRNKHQALPLLGDEERGAYETRRTDLQTRLAELTPALGVFAERLNQANRWLETQTARQQFTTEQTALTAEQSAAAPARLRLGEHERAFVFAPDLAALDQQFAEQTFEQDALRSLLKSIPELEEAVKRSGAVAADAQTALQKAQEQTESQKPLWEEIDLLDQEIAVARAAATEASRQSAEAEKRAASATVAQTKAADTQRELEGRQQKIQAWLAEHPTDAIIEEKRPDLVAAGERWSSATRSQNTAQKELTKTKDDLGRLGKLTEDARLKIAPLEAGYLTVQKSVQQAEEALKEITGGKALTDLESQRETVRRRSEQLDRLSIEATRLDQLRAKIAAQTKEAERLRSELHAVAAERERAESLCVEAVKLVEAQQTALGFAERLQSLEQHRASLESGQPCPLCGATDHPFAEPGATLPTEVDAARRTLASARDELQSRQTRFTELEKQSAGLTGEQKRVTDEIAQGRHSFKTQHEIWSTTALALEIGHGPEESAKLAAALTSAQAESQRARQIHDAARAADVQRRDLIEAAQQAFRALEKQRTEWERQSALGQQMAERLTALTPELEKTNATLAGERTLFLSLIAPFGEIPETAEAAAVLLADLKKRADTYAKQHAAGLKLAGELSEQKARTEALISETAAAQVAVEKARPIAHTANVHLAERQQVRTAKFGEKVVVQARREAEALQERLRTAFETTRTEAEKQHHTWEKTVEKKTGLETSIQRRAGNCEAQQKALAERATAVGFSDIAAIRASLLPADEATTLAANRARLEKWHITLTERAAQLDRKVAELPATAAEDATNLESLKIERARLETAQTEINRALWDVESDLKRDDQLRIQQRGISTEIEAARREFARWDRLRALIGSADGSAFARFAQGLTLERLTSLANRHLGQLNPRYRVRRASGQAADDLELEIVDHYQADTARPMRSLSGGESFLVSLSLALGLSELASGSTAIESIFIDEGFGTLDADSLEVAMAALENLQAGGKTIGVISHVPAMQERIASQIRVIKESGGCSRVEVV